MPDRRARQLRAYAAAGSGLLLALSFPPFDLGALALVALVPLCWAWRDASSRDAAAYGAAFGIVFFAITLEWARYFGAIEPAKAARTSSAAEVTVTLVRWPYT